MQMSKIDSHLTKMAVSIHQELRSFTKSSVGRSYKDMAVHVGVSTVYVMCKQFYYCYMYLFRCMQVTARPFFDTRFCFTILSSGTLLLMEGRAFRVKNCIRYKDSKRRGGCFRYMSG